MNELQPLVSIITITQNRAHLISRAIESIQNQTYKNFEHIILDCGSKDNTEEVVGAYKDSRIKFIQLTSDDFLKSVKIGFEFSKGDFITFLDDDDEYLAAKIEKQVSLIITLPETYGFVYCWMDYYDNATKKFIKTHKPQLRGDVASEVVEKEVLSGTPTYFIRRKAFEQLGGWRYDIGIISDWEYAARACQYYLVDFVPESLVKIYVNHGSLRMSDPNYYDDGLQRQIKFHSYFLSEFKPIFDKYPKKMATHLYAIARSFFMLGEWKKGWIIYKSLLSKSITLKYILLPAFCILKRKRTL